MYKHDKSGAEVLSVIAPDENKVFGVNFRTPPKDSTGVPHILEHSVSACACFASLFSLSFVFPFCWVPSEFVAYVLLLLPVVVLPYISITVVLSLHSYLRSIFHHLPAPPAHSLRTLAHSTAHPRLDLSPYPFPPSFVHSATYFFPHRCCAARASTLPRSPSWSS